jgi:NTE family protein
MASSALPLFFPAVQLEDRWHGDGGVRLTSPLAPAINLGARRIIAVSTRSRRAKTEAHVEGPHSYPSPAQVAGVLLNSVFLDLLDQDALHLRRINRLLEKTGSEASDGLEPIDLLLLRPSQDLGALAGRYEARLPKGFRFLTRGLGSRDDKGSDLISMLMFQRDYIERLIEIGEADGDAQSDELDRILSTAGPCP